MYWGIVLLKFYKKKIICLPLATLSKKSFEIKSQVIISQVEQCLRFFACLVKQPICYQTRLVQRRFCYEGTCNKGMTDREVRWSMQHTFVSIRMKIDHYLWDFGGHFGWHHWSVWVSRNHWNSAKFERQHIYFFSTAPADGLAPLCARTSAGEWITE